MSSRRSARNPELAESVSALFNTDDKMPLDSDGDEDGDDDEQKSQQRPAKRRRRATQPQQQQQSSSASKPTEAVYELEHGTDPAVFLTHASSADDAVARVCHSFPDCEKRSFHSVARVDTSSPQVVRYDLWQSMPSNASPAADGHHVFTVAREQTPPYVVLASSADEARSLVSSQYGPLLNDPRVTALSRTPIKIQRIAIPH